MHTVNFFKQKYKVLLAFKSGISCPHRLYMHYCNTGFYALHRLVFYNLKEFKLEYQQCTANTVNKVKFLLNPEHYFKDHLKECIDKAVKQFHPPAVRASFAASCTESIDLSVTTITTALGMPIRPPLVEEIAVCTANRSADPAETEEGTLTFM